MKKPDSYSYLCAFKSKNIIEDRFLRKKEKRILFYRYFCFLFSILGYLETFYLSISKINGNLLLCSDQNCSNVLNSVFSYFLDIPLSCFGCVIYFLSSVQIYKTLTNKNEKNSKKIFWDISSIFIPLLLSIFSCYFVFILENILKIPCPWCFSSIFLSGCLLLFSTISSIGDDAFEIESSTFFLLLTGILIFTVNALDIIEIQNF